MKTFIRATLLVFHVGCGAISSISETAEVVEPTGTESVAPEWEAPVRDLLAENQILIVGEMHGNEEGPQSLWQTASLALEHHGAVSIGLETPESDTEILQAWMASDGLAEDSEALLQAWLWHPEMFDGRGTQAAMRMLEKARRTRQSGADLEVFAFVRPGEHDPGDQNPHEQRMADVITEHAQARPGRKVVILVGNLHAMIRPISLPEMQEIKPMAMKVRALIPETVTIRLAHSGGQSWGHGSEGPSLIELSDQDVPNTFELLENDDYDARWPVGDATPSLPAHPEVVLPD